jgi:plastocyanin
MRAWVLLLAIVVISPAAIAHSATVRFHASLDRQDGKTGDSAGVVAWLTPVSGTVTPSLPGHFRLVQKNKQFEPHLLVIPVGSAVDFPNQDPFFHNVFSLYNGKRFDLGLYEAGTSKAVQFDRVGVSFIFCNIHPDMSAVVLTMVTPYYAVANAAGEMAIRNVPDGKYRLKVWHERASPEALQSVERELTVTGDVTIPLRVTEVVGPSMPHKNKYGKDYEKAPDYQPR